MQANLISVEIIYFYDIINSHKGKIFSFGRVHMLSDIEIARRANMKKITEVAKTAGIKEEEIEQYGSYKAKLSDSLLNRIETEQDGKLILVTAVNPTPAMPLLPCVSRHWVRFSASRAVPPAAVTARLCRWKISIFILPVICMRSQVRII